MTAGEVPHPGLAAEADPRIAVMSLVEFRLSRIAEIAVALQPLAAFEVRKMELAPAHAITGDAVIHPFGVLKSVGHRVVVTVVVVDADTIWCARRSR
jgi:hypothetical protein